MKNWWRENRYDIKDAARTIACFVGVGLFSNSLLLWRVKKIVKKATN